jgi:hypothetical protein
VDIAQKTEWGKFRDGQDSEGLFMADFLSGDTGTAVLCADGGKF